MQRGSEPTRSERRTAPSRAVLLVEDDELVRRLVRTVLQLGGYSVLEAGDGESALRLIQEHRRPIDLLLTDVVMPQMSGAQLADRVVRLCPEIKVLFMSGYTDGSVERYGVSDAAEAFIAKPFAPSLLVQKVRDALN